MIRNLKSISRLWYYIFIVYSGLAILLAVNQIFKLKLFGFLPIDTGYLYYLLALYLSCSFILYPAIKRTKEMIPWYDVLLFIIANITCGYMAINAINISLSGWAYQAPLIPRIFSIIIWILVLEAVRRSSGIPIFIICAVFSLFPLFASHLPGFLMGMQYDFWSTASSHAMSLNSILGVPMTTVGTLLIGFMLFGVVLGETGGGEFFHDLANGLLGRRRGGAAKVSVMGSALFGSLSGSAISNVVTTGTITIPTMKKTGYSSTYAGAIEACASTGGTITPPIMGTAAFVMASFMQVSYATIVIAAIIPSLLFYLGLFIQADCYAAKNKLRVLTEEEIPSVRETLKAGWQYVFVLLMLFYFLFYLRIETWAPFFAILTLLVISQLKKSTRISKERFLSIIASSGKVLIELVCLLAAIGLIVGSLSMTGVALAFSRELVNVVGDNLYLLLLAGALTSFVLGCGMTSTACYIFLAIVLVPALITIGVSPMAAHFFVLYWGIVSYITPPVALAAFAAAKIAGSDAMKTGLVSMRLGIVTYFVPFLFVFDPRLVAVGSLTGIIYSLAKTAIGVILIGCALEGYLIGVEMKLKKYLRFLIAAIGITITLPYPMSDFIGLILACGVIIALFAYKKILRSRI
ncbi:MAG: TRAP transporter permease [Desulfitobacteriia bacterium]